MEQKNINQNKDFFMSQETRTDKYKPRTPEADARQRAHWFGADGGNKPMPSIGGSMRMFYKWCESVATADELKAYVNDDANPAARRKFVAALMNCERVQDFFDLTNQTHGYPKQVVETTELPPINCEVFGDANRAGE